eukprot:gene12706-15939_t
MIASLLLVILVAASLMDGIAAQTQTLTGHVLVQRAPGAEEVTLLQTPGSDGYVELKFPSPDDGGLRPDLSSGDEVTVNVQQGGSSDQAVDVLDLEVLAAKWFGGKGAKASSTVGFEERELEADVSKDFSSITYLLGMCGKPLGVSKDQVTSTWFDAYSTPNQGSLEGWFNACSFGKERFTSSTNVITPAYDIPCSGNAPSGRVYSPSACDYESFLSWLELAQAHAINDGYDPNAYTHQFIIVPNRDLVRCGWAGTSDAGCYRGRCLSIIRAQYATTLPAITHELGHSLFLQHAWRGGKEYQDATSQMGLACCSPICYNAPQTWSLGWASPVAVFAGESSLPAGKWISSVIPEFLSSSRNFVQIIPTWAGGDKGNIFLSYKRAVSYNSGINYGGFVSYKLEIHTYAGNDATGTMGTYVLTDLEAVVDIGEVYTSSWSALSFTVVRVDKNTMKFFVCHSTYQASCYDNVPPVESSGPIGFWQHTPQLIPSPRQILHLPQHNPRTGGQIVNKTVNKITRSCADTAGEDSKVSELRFTLCGTVEVETSLPAAVNAQRPTLNSPLSRASIPMAEAEVQQLAACFANTLAPQKIVNKTVNKITRSCADTAGEDSKVSELRFTLCGTVEVETSLPAAVNAQRPTLNSPLSRASIPMAEAEVQQLAACFANTLAPQKIPQAKIRRLPKLGTPLLLLELPAESSFNSNGRSRGPTAGRLLREYACATEKYRRRDSKSKEIRFTLCGDGRSGGPPLPQQSTSQRPNISDPQQLGEQLPSGPVVWRGLDLDCPSSIRGGDSPALPHGGKRYRPVNSPAESSFNSPKAEADVQQLAACSTNTRL